MEKEPILTVKDLSIAFHMYDKGAHGLSTAGRLSQRADGEKLQPECEGWMSLLETWINAIL